MRQTSGKRKSHGEKVVRDIRRATRRQYSAEERIRIVLDGLKGEDTIAELCRRESIAQGPYKSWSKEFLEAGKRRLAGDTARAASKSEVKDLRQEAVTSKRLLPSKLWSFAFSKKHDRGWGRRRMKAPASEKIEIIRLVEQSYLPAKRTLDKLGNLKTT